VELDAKPRKEYQNGHGEQETGGTLEDEPIGFGFFARVEAIALLEVFQQVRHAERE
jgi:hypothetical protein